MLQLEPLPVNLELLMLEQEPLLLRLGLLLLRSEGGARGSTVRGGGRCEGVEIAS